MFGLSLEQRYPTSTICYPRNICQNNQQKIRQFSEVIDFIDEWKKKISIVDIDDQGLSGLYFFIITLHSKMIHEFEFNVPLGTHKKFRNAF